MTRKPRRRREARAAWPRWLAVCGALSTLGVVALQSSAPPPDAAARRDRTKPAGYDLLTATLDRRRRCFLIPERTRFLDSLKEQVPALEPPLLWVLDRPNHELFDDAALLAAELHVTAAIEPLESAAWGQIGPARVPALLALDQLQPLTDDELLELLTLDDPPQVAAALRMLKQRSGLAPRVLQAVLELLRHPIAELRAAALAVLPAELPEGVVDDVLNLVDDPVAGATAATLLARVPPTPANIAVFARRLADAEANEQTALLSTIDRYASAEPVRKVLRELAGKPGPVAVRTAAIYSLERSRDDWPLPAEAYTWPPLLRLFGARLRIRNGHRDGIDMLLELAGNEDEDARAVHGQARLLLSRLANLAPHTDLEVFAQWAAQLRAVPDVDLPPPIRP